MTLIEYREGSTLKASSPGLWLSNRSYTRYPPRAFLSSLSIWALQWCRYPGKVVMPVGVYPEAVIFPRECLGGADISNNQACSSGW